MIIEGNHKLINLKAAVVIAYIYEEGEETVSLVYQPVSFDEIFAEENFKTLRKFKLYVVFCSVMSCLIGLSCALYRYIERKNVKDAKDAMKTSGYQMRTMSQNTSMADTSRTSRSDAEVATDFDSSYQGSARPRSGRNDSGSNVSDEDI